MNSSPKIPVIIAVGDFASGVTSWAFRLRDAFSDHPRYVIRLLNCSDTGNRIGRFDLHATSVSRARTLIAACGEAVVIPNFVWDLFPVCAELAAEGQALRCIGFCRADSAREYYEPLAFYKPLIDTFAAVSPECGSHLVQRLGVAPESIHTLPSGVLVPDTLDRTYQTTPIRLAYGGRIVQEQKRVLDFVPLVRSLYKHNVDFRFTIVGSGREREELRAALSEVDPEKRVHVGARRKPETMPKFWASQDIFVQVSDFEGTSNSMLESMAQGAVPVVTRTRSGVEGIVHDGVNGFLANPGDMDTLAGAVATLAASPGRLRAMGQRAHESMKPFSIDGYAERFEAMLDATMAAPIRTWPPETPLKPRAPFPGVRLTGKTTGKGRIAILFPSPLRGGAEDYTLTIAAGAVQAGYDVQGCFSGRQALKSLSRDYFKAGAFHNTLEICDIGAKSGQAPVLKRFTRTLRTLRRLRPRAVLFQLCGMQYGLVSQLTCALYGTPTLVVFQLVRDDLRFSPFRRMLHRWMRHRGHRYVAVSVANRALLARAFAMDESEILLIPNGVRLSRFQSDEEERKTIRKRILAELDLEPETRLCLTVGRLSAQKGHDILIPAIPHIVAACPQAHFIWAGEGPSRKKLEEQLATYGVASHVTLLGRRTDIRELLLASDLLVHPARFEGQPFSLLEAMAAGLPIVCTRASGIPEIIEDGVHGILCRPDDIGALRSAVIQALEHPASMAQFAGAARKHVALFSESAMIEQTLHGLDAIVGER